MRKSLIMIVFPNAKINIGLYITHKRLDGYHNIETVFYPIPLCDVLEITINHNSNQVFFDNTGLQINGNPSDNLCVKAYQLLQKQFHLQGVDMVLYKKIPMGAGLGGGSSNAAFVLKLTNTLFNLNLSNNQLAELASQLGSDCAFFVYNEPMLAHGRGDELSPITINLKNYFLVVVKPPIHVSTAEAYQLISPKTPAFNLAEVIKQPVENWHQLIANDFEEPIFKKYPQIADIKNRLYQLGAVYASMSGSGSSVFGLFNSQIDIENKFPDSFVFMSKLS